MKIQNLGEFGSMATRYLLILAALTGLVSSSNDCHACLEGDCYSKTPIMDGYRFSGQLAVDRTENIVYFHYEDGRSIDYTAAFDLDDIRFKIIPNIGFSFARAVDQSTRNVYMGGAKGIFIYNPISNNTVQHALSETTIVHMQYKNKLYYTILNTKGIFTLENKRSKAIPALSNYTINDFIIDYQNDVYFLSESNVYRLKKGGKSPTVIADDIYSLSIDKFETAHFVHSGKRGLYKLDSKTDELIEVGAFGDGLSLRSVFDNNNNIIYHENNSRKLFYLLPNYGRCIVSRKSHGIKAKEPLKGFGQNSTILIEETKPEVLIQRIS